MSSLCRDIYLSSLLAYLGGQPLQDPEQCALLAELRSDMFVRFSVQGDPPEKIKGDRDTIVAYVDKLWLGNGLPAILF